MQGWVTNSNVGKGKSARRTKNQNTDKKKILEKSVDIGGNVMCVSLSPS